MAYLGSDLVTALTGLEVNNFPHICRFRKEKFGLKYHDLMGLVVPLNFSRRLRGVKETQLQSERGRAYLASSVRQLAELAHCAE